MKCSSYKYNYYRIQIYADAHLLLEGGCRQWWRLWHLGWRGRRVWVWGRGEIQMYVQKYRNTYAKLMWWSIKRRWNTRKLRSKKTNSFFEGERLAWPWGDTERVWRPLLQSDAQGTVGYAPKYTQICPNMSNMLKQFKYAQKCKIHPNMPKFSPSITCAQNPGSNRGQPDRYWQRRQLVQPTKEEVFRIWWQYRHHNDDITMVISQLVQPAKEEVFRIRWQYWS